MTAELHSERRCADGDDRDGRYARNDIQRPVSTLGDRLEAREALRWRLRFDTVELVPKSALQSRADVNHL